MIEDFFKWQYRVLVSNEFSYITGRNAKWEVTLENFDSFLEGYIHNVHKTQQPQVLTQEIWKRVFHANIYSNFIHN